MHNLIIRLLNIFVGFIINVCDTVTDRAPLGGRGGVTLQVTLPLIVNDATIRSFISALNFAPYGPSKCGPLQLFTLSVNTPTL